MTKYLETKKNSIEEVIKSVVLGEAMSGQDVAKRMMKIKTMKSFANKVAKMKTVSRGDLEKILPDYISGGDITKVIKEKLDPVNKVAVKKKFDNRKDKDIDNDGDVDSTDKYLHKRRKAISKAISKEEVEIDEGYESEVMKVLNKADIDGYFKMGKLYVSRRDARDAKKALDDSDEITKLPKMVMEDERMKKLTKRQRQALARVQAKPKSQVSLPKMPDFIKLKKEEVEMNINEKVEYVEYEFKNRGDAMKAKRYFDGIQLMDFDVNDDNIGRGQLMVDAGNRDMTRYHKEVMKKFNPRVVKSESYDIGNDYAKHTLDVTPGQNKNDVDEMLGIAQKKNVSMREALAKVWGMDEGASPFGKKPLTKEEKHGKTMTGQKPTKVEVEPKMEKK